MDADRLEATPLRPSAPLTWFVRAWEGCILSPYFDVAGKCTIGVGHLMKDEDSRDPITEEQATALLESDLSHVGSQVLAMATVPLLQYQFDALCDFAFNLGTHALNDSTLLRLVNLGQFGAAGYEFPKWSHAHINGVSQVVEGLMRRRAAERAMFERADYAGRP